MTSFEKTCGNYARDTRGNIAILFGVTLTVILFAIATAIDFARMTSVSAKLNDLTDGAALAGAFVADSHPDTRRQNVLNSLTENGYYSSSEYGAVEPEIIFDDQNREVRVRIEAPLGLLFSGVLGGDKPIFSESVASYLTEEITPVSISFALDVSGSMGDDTPEGEAKIQVLKDATRTLFSAMESSVRNPAELREILRTGMTAYNTEVVATEAMDWGWDSLETSVDDLFADGGTNSTPALEASLNQLVDDFHKPAGLRQFIIFMTDGNNNEVDANGNSVNWDADSYAVCLDAQAQGIEIYSVAFSAPEKGQALLFDCASPNENNPNGNGNEVDENGEPCNAGAGVGHGYGRCKKIKSEHYFDAEDAEAFEAAFRRIGEEIAKIDLRIKS